MALQFSKLNIYFWLKAYEFIECTSIGTKFDRISLGYRNWIQRKILFYGFAREQRKVRDVSKGSSDKTKCDQ